MFDTIIIFLYFVISILFLKNPRIRMVLQRQPGGLQIFDTDPPVIIIDFTLLMYIFSHYITK